uniref:DUF7802 domain-containing protein n=1 Tax=Cacopsylla melanoneura TaxID=428564 RepID=A0A8D8TFX0_9HEMI
MDITDKNEPDMDGAWNWLIKINNIQELWERQPTYLLVQAVYLFGALMTFLHACSSKGRWPLFWCGTVCHGLVIEALCFFLPEDVADNYWHSQTPVMFLGGRLPLHIVILYPCFYYQATAAVNKFGFSIRTEPFAVALLVLLQDIPYDIIGVKFIHWSWHDTDPNLFDRTYWVPWNSYFFHLTFSASYTFWFHWLRLKLGRVGDRRDVQRDWRHMKWEIGRVFTETISFVFSSILGVVGGTVWFMIIYHPLHDILGVHTEVCFFALLAMFCLIVWRALVFGGANEKACRVIHTRDYLLLIHITVHYSIFLLLTIFAHPENEVSIGYHEQIGPCNETVMFPSAVGKLLTKRKYLCLSDYNEQYFDFHCTPYPPPPYTKWYPICGTPFTNRAEYIVLVTIPAVMAAFVFGSIYSKQKTDGRKKIKVK